MSLLTDDDYLILQLRLAYLRRVDDHVGPRVISVTDVVNLPPQHDLFDVRREQAKRATRQSSRANGPKEDALGSLGVHGLGQELNTSTERGDGSVQDTILPRYRADEPVVIAGLNDAQLHPELTTLYSPRVTADFPHLSNALLENPFSTDASIGAYGDVDEVRDGQRTRSTSLGAGSLKYTTTIYGAGRTGALGMRVSGRHNNSSDNPSRRRSKDATAKSGMLGTALNMSRAATATLPREAAANGKLASTRRASDQSERSTSARKLREGELLASPKMQVPELAVQASTYESDENRRLNKRSASLREASHSYSSEASAFAESRRRSSSQPHRSGLPSGLSNTTAAGGQAAVIAASDPATAAQASGDTSRDEGKDPRVVRAVVPPRPPRKPRTSISDQSVTSTSGMSASRLLSEDETGSGPKVLSQEIDGRPRSQSEAIMPGSMPVSAYPGTRERSKTDASAQGKPSAAERFKSYLPSTNSGSTLFSLASPLSARRGGTSTLSQQSDTSGPSMDHATGERYHQSAMFEPVAEDLEGSSTGEQSHDDEVGVGAANVRVRAASDPRDALSKNRRANRDVFLSPLRAQKSFGQMSHTTDGTGDDGGESPVPVPTSSEAAIAPILTAAAGPNRASMHPSVTPVLSSMDTSSGAAAAADGDATTSRNDGEAGRSGDFLRRSTSFFAKEDRAAVKKRFEARSSKSALSALISNRSEGPSNLFNQYKSVAGSAVASGNSTTVELFFPFASKSNPVWTAKPVSGALALNPASRSMRLSVRKDATMEELIGYGLYCYAEEDWRPRLAEALAPEATEEEREIRLSTVAWTLRIVEDGEVDDDYPAVDRSLTVGKFGADELAVCEATAAQIRQNRSSSSMLGKRVIRQRQMSTGLGSLRPPTVGTLGRPSVTSPARQGTTVAVATGLPQIDSNATLQGTPVFGMSVVGPRAGSASPGSGLVGGAGGSSERPYVGAGMPIFLRILVTPNPDVRYKTTLQVTSDRYLADVLETICKRRELGNAEKWAFMVPEKDIVVPLDRTVESLQGAYDLVLVRRQDLGAQRTGALTTQSTNPNASIFKRASQPANPHGREIVSVYKSYTVNRRMPTFLGRHERILTIDGDWLHIIPTDTRAFQSHTATTSYPIASIVSCTQSRAASSFKLLVMRENDQKRYDFEAESSKAAAEIVQEINALLRRK